MCANNVVVKQWIVTCVGMNSNHVFQLDEEYVKYEYWKFGAYRINKWIGFVGKRTYCRFHLCRYKIFNQQGNSWWSSKWKFGRIDVAFLKVLLLKHTAGHYMVTKQCIIIIILILNGLTAFIILWYISWYLSGIIINESRMFILQLSFNCLNACMLHPPS